MHISLKTKLSTYKHVSFNNHEELEAALKKEEYVRAEYTIDPGELEHFASLMSALPSTSIEDIEINCGKLSDEETEIVVTSLLQQPKLEALDFQSIELGEMAEKALIKYLPSSKLKRFSIYEYDGSYVGITDAQTVNLINALPSELKSLSLCFVNIGDLAAVALAEVLPQKSNLENLIFGGDYNNITQAGINALTSALPTSSLTSLQFNGTDAMGDMEAIALLNTVKNSNIKSLILRENNIGPEVANFFSTLKHPLELKHLDLSRNLMGDELVAALAMASKFIHISELCLEDIAASPKAMNHLFAALKDNYAIVTLESKFPLSHNLIEILARNQNLKLIANRLNNNLYLSDKEIEPLLRVMNDESVDVKYIQNAREKISMLNFAKEFLSENFSSPDAQFSRLKLYKEDLDSLALTVANRYFKGHAEVGDSNIAAKIFSLIQNSRELKPAITDINTARFIADKLNDKNDNIEADEKINAVIENFQNIQKNSNAVELFKAYPSKIGSFLVMPAKELDGILTSIFTNKYAYQALVTNPNLLFQENGIELLKTKGEVEELKEQNSQLKNQITGKKRSRSFVDNLTDERDNKSKSAESASL